MRRGGSFVSQAAQSLPVCSVSAFSINDILIYRRIGDSHTHRLSERLGACIRAHEGKFIGQGGYRLRFGCSCKTRIGSVAPLPLAPRLAFQFEKD